MSIYVVTGVLGNGKTLLAVSRIKEYLKEGRRVATNLDLRLEKMLPRKFKNTSCVRLPDKPSAADLLAMGRGAEGKLDEKRYGLLVLDELGSWLNSRAWNEKGRADLIDWLIHARKHRWDVILLIQDEGSLDKQVRDALMEYLVKCKRLDKVKVPLFGRLGKLLSLGAWDGCIGRLHLGVVRYVGGAMTLQGALVVDHWLYRGTDLFDSYDTEQVFTSTYDCGIYSYLPPWQQWGRYQPPTGWEKFVLDLRVQLGLDSRPRRKLAPHAKLKPLLSLSADLRWQAARSLVMRGVL